jgi:glucose-6-phosphate 1-dehydrogenase
MNYPKIKIRTREPERAVVARGPAETCQLIVFGVTGDLAGRKLIPALYHLDRENALAEGTEIIGFSRSVPDDKTLREHLLRQAEKYSRSTIDNNAWAAFEKRITGVAGSADDPEAYRRLLARLEEEGSKRATGGNRLFYLATPASAFPTILKHLKETGLVSRPRSGAPWSRVIVEKPFGRDLASAMELNRVAARTLDESQIYRIDHYLGKETVQNILVLRFANAIFEPVWNRKHIDHIQITAAESIDIEGRGRFYEETGVLRDIVQNHLLQVLALVAMEAPVSFEADEIRDMKTMVFRSLRPIIPELAGDIVVRGQYKGYLQESAVASDSRVPTFMAMRAEIDNWRWQGVPFYLRAGKGLGKKVTEVAIHFKPIPHCLFGSAEVCHQVEDNVLVIRIQPDEGMQLRLASKVPGRDFTIGSVAMDFLYAGGFGKELPEAYERLLLDAVNGDATLYARRDGVEESWRYVTPILEAWEADQTGPLPQYRMGSEGPREAEALLRRDGRMWRRLG